MFEKVTGTVKEDSDVRSIDQDTARNDDMRAKGSDICCLEQ